MKKAKILFYDLETSPNEGYSFGGKWEVNITAFKKYSELLSFAYKFSGDKEIQVFSRRLYSEKQLLTRLNTLLSEADIVVAHNGDSFDQKVTRTRMLANKMRPLKILATVDTKKVAKSNFAFVGNSLEDLSSFFGIGKKVKHPGIEMWLGCMAGDKKAWALMEKYNKRDIDLLEKCYDYLRPWANNHPNVARILNPHSKDLGVCPNCGSHHVQKRGFRAAKTTINQQWVCMDCGRWFLTRLPKQGEK